MGNQRKGWRYIAAIQGTSQGYTGTDVVEYEFWGCDENEAWEQGKKKAASGGWAMILSDKISEITGPMEH